MMKTIVESSIEIIDLGHAIQKIHAFNQEDTEGKLQVMVKVKIEFKHFTKPEVIEMEIPKSFLYYHGMKDMIEVLKAYNNKKREELSDFLLSGIVK